MVNIGQLGWRDVPGLEDYTFPMTRDTQEIDEMCIEVQAIDVPLQPTGGAPRPRGSQHKALFEEVKKLWSKGGWRCCGSLVDPKEDSMPANVQVNNNEDVTDIATP